MEVIITVMIPIILITGWGGGGGSKVVCASLTHEDGEIFTPTWLVLIPLIRLIKANQRPSDGSKVLDVSGRSKQTCGRG